jgi:hypothetical protein
MGAYEQRRSERGWHQPDDLTARILVRTRRRAACQLLHEETSGDQRWRHFCLEDSVAVPNQPPDRE